MKLADKFELSRGRALDDVEAELKGLRAELSALKAGATGAATPPPIATSWRYNAAEFPFFSDNIYALEQAGDQVKRWIGPEPRLDLELRLRRDVRVLRGQHEDVEVVRVVQDVGRLLQVCGQRR